ncbi:hypothetical protein [Glaciimonas sp. PAMC28666]|uniref:hypothetical protein n=1 Tax=Glaciimonas sp. PAMC28666 TaxID=2807626 RepID=UPI001962FDCC|nr:hypothetical protein [Glaciimonas sp. PAMC28666]QRX81204.1 hypothetical protein JQN73_13475 [Glaciimonas sp. PAMC28666]
MSKSIAAESSSELEAFHQPFSWLPSHHQHDAAAQFYAQTLDVCRGVETCIDLAHLSNSDRGTDTLPTLTIRDTERLLRLALMSSRMLGDATAARIDNLLEDNLPEDKLPGHNISSQKEQTDDAPVMDKKRHGAR